MDSKISIARTGEIEIYYPSRPNLEKCIKTFERCYVPENGALELKCVDPVDPLDLAFEYTITVNWKGTGMKCAEAKVDLHQWLDPRTGEYVFQLPDKMGRVIWPSVNYIYQGYCPVRIITVDQDDEQGKRSSCREAHE